MCAQSCPAFCNPMDCSLTNSSVHGIFQARILEWVPTPEDLANPGIKPMSLVSPELTGRFFITAPSGKSNTSISSSVDPIHENCNTYSCLIPEARPVRWNCSLKELFNVLPVGIS